MADVAVLPPQDCLTPHRHHQPHRNHKSTQRRRNSPPPRPTKARTQARPITPPMAGPIRILKRGEDLPQLKPVAEPDPVMRVAEPEPVMWVSEPVPSTLVAESEAVMRVDWFYAGSGFVSSPPPSSLPLPAFFTAGKRNCSGATATEADDIATGLRRLLNLQ